MIDRSLRNGLTGGSPLFLLEAHDGLSAKIAEAAGFRAIWASGLAISSAHGVRDANELSWSQVVDAVDVITDSVAVPVLVDGDTGHGDHNVARRFTRQLSQRGAAGVCLEDKRYPKLNSFANGPQLLDDIEHFANVIAACREGQRSDDFVLVARTEALIAGCSVEEALERSERYREAGADAVMIHWRGSSADPILSFARTWQRRSPVLVSPTTYYKTPTAKLVDAGVDGVIWGNHLLRAAVRAMRETAAEILAENSVATVEESIASIDELFSLLDYAALARQQARYGVREPASRPMPGTPRS